MRRNNKYLIAEWIYQIFIQKKKKKWTSANSKHDVYVLYNVSVPDNWNEQLRVIGEPM